MERDKLIMKTAFEWGAEFADTPFGQVLWENLADQVKEDNTPMHLGTLISMGIDWEKSPLGAGFWIMVFSVVMKLEKLHRESVTGVESPPKKLGDIFKDLL